MSQANSKTCTFHMVLGLSSMCQWSDYCMEHERAVPKDVKINLKLL